MSEQIDISKMKVKELKAECKRRGIKKYSKLKKQELINLLKPKEEGESKEEIKVLPKQKKKIIKCK